jgi:hypothetical protein
LFNYIAPPPRVHVFLFHNYANVLQEGGWHTETSMPVPKLARGRCGVRGSWWCIRHTPMHARGPIISLQHTTLWINEGG